MSGGGVEGPIGGGCDAPDYGLFGREERVELGGEGETAVASEGDAVEFAFYEIGEAGHFPCGGGGGGRGGGGKKEKTEQVQAITPTPQCNGSAWICGVGLWPAHRSPHSLTSIWTVRE